MLRIVDGEVAPMMPFLYQCMRITKDGVAKSSQDNKWVLKIIDKQWKNTIRHALHDAAYFLNPKYQYQPNLGENPTYFLVVNVCYSTLYPEDSGAAQFENEAKEDCLIDLDPLDLASISVHLNDTNEDPLFEWIRPSHLDQPDGAPDPNIVGHAQAMGINVDRVMVEEVGTSSDKVMKIINDDDDNNDDGDGTGRAIGGRGNSGGDVKSGVREVSQRPILFSCQE
ncbi:hypothetical protein F0562_018223 [Nyssa sinensis]|uniref:Uncharacterized protein n=1 Tax=Nyssa sinensis TaxID=561372 RepID=A0A5J4ZCK9_9ASTE|nr:hypothetical protein F0562_018223 [Nyssa sinensis]